MNKHCAYQDPVDFAVTTLIASEHRNSMPLNLSPCVPAELTAKLGQGSQYISYTINISTLGSIFSPVRQSRVTFESRQRFAEGLVVDRC